MPYTDINDKNESFRRHYRAKKAFIWQWKSTGCVECGINDPVVLDADHIDELDKNPKLRFNQKGKARPMTALSWAELKEELAKCQVLCANCHRKRTYERKYLGLNNVLTQGAINE